MRKIIYIICILSALFKAEAQTEYKSKVLNPFLFYNYQNDRYTIIDDSTGCHEYNSETKTWEFKPITFQLQETFSRFIDNYNVLNERGSEIFFVDKGCGVVYVIKNDTVKRHDLSGHLENQFNGTFFLYKGEPHIFGGYGLFQFKNIITRYDVKEKEWFCYDANGLCPDPRQGSFGRVFNNQLYIIGGLGGKTKAMKRYNDVWRFNFSDLKWERLGKFNNYTKEDQLLIPNKSVAQNSPVLLRYDFFYEPIFTRNILNVFQLKQQGKTHSLIPINSTCLVHKIDTKGLFSTISIIDRSVIFKKLLFTGPIISSPPSYSSMTIFIYSVMLLIVIIICMYFLLVYRPKRQAEGFRRFLTLNEKALLDLFLNNSSEGIEISLVNDLVSYDDPSVDTLKKRRDNLLKELKQKLAIAFQLDTEQVFIEEKHHTDKRIKILKLNKKISENVMKKNRGK
jgi:hypothetical protein